MRNVDTLNYSINYITPHYTFTHSKLNFILSSCTVSQVRVGELAAAAIKQVNGLSFDVGTPPETLGGEYLCHSKFHLTDS